MTAPLRIDAIDAEELGLIHSRVTASLILAGFKPGSVELDEATAPAFRAQIEAIEADRKTKREARASYAKRRSQFRVVG